MKNNQRLTDRVQLLLAKVSNACIELEQLYPGVPFEDPRKSIAINIHSFLGNIYLNAIHFDDHLSNDTWWRKKGLDKIFDNQKKKQKDYLIQMGWDLIVDTFFIFESGIRKIVRAWDPTVCNSGNDSFYNLYDWLIKRLKKSNWSFSIGEPLEFLNFYRITRNTWHNNGEYFPEKHNNVSCTWRGVTHHFICSQHRDFFLEDCFLLIEDLIELNLQIMKNNLVKNLATIL